MKNMRGKKGTDLIFSGKNLNLNRASVEIVFDNTKKFLDIDYEKVIIERVVYKDGINEYFINKNKVRVKDIIELLVSANIGPTGYHIISQGEADKIISVNPKDRKMIIEEALGLKSFVIKKADAEKRLKKVYENLKEVKVNLKVITPRILFLKREVDKINKSKELTQELKNLYKYYFSEKLKIKEEYFNSQKIVKEKILKKEEIEKDIIFKKEEINKLNFKNQQDQKNKKSAEEEILKIKKELSEVFILKSKLQKEIFSIQYEINLFHKKEKEIEQKIKEGYNAKEIYDKKIELVSVVLHHSWSL
jgi:chromosome segregation protein